MQSKTLTNTFRKLKVNLAEISRENEKLLTQENPNEQRTTVETIVQLPHQFGLQQTLIHGETNSQLK